MTVPRENQRCGLCVKFRPDQPKHAVQAFPKRHYSPPVDFLFQELLIYTSIPLRQNVSNWISLRGLRRLILIDTLRRGHNVGFLAGRLKCEISGMFKPNIRKIQ